MAVAGSCAAPLLARASVPPMTRAAGSSQLSGLTRALAQATRTHPPSGEGQPGPGQLTGHAGLAGFWRTGQTQQQQWQLPQLQHVYGQGEAAAGPALRLPDPLVVIGRNASSSTGSSPGSCLGSTQILETLPPQHEPHAAHAALHACHMLTSCSLSPSGLPLPATSALLPTTQPPQPLPPPPSQSGTSLAAMRLNPVPNIADPVAAVAPDALLTMDVQFQPFLPHALAPATRAAAPSGVMAGPGVKAGLGPGLGPGPGSGTKSSQDVRRCGAGGRTGPPRPL